MKGIYFSFLIPDTGWILPPENPDVFPSRRSAIFVFLTIGRGADRDVNLGEFLPKSYHNNRDRPATRGTVSEPGNVFFDGGPGLMVQDLTLMGQF